MSDLEQTSPVAAPAAPPDPASLPDTGQVMPAGFSPSAQPPETRIVAIVAEKGGVGKTTTAVNLAAALVEADHECLLIDMDAQGGGATGALGVRVAPTDRSVLTILLEQASFSDAIVRTNSGIDLVPSNFSLAGLAFMADLAKEMRLRNALAQFIHAPDCPYSYIFIDCPPRLDVFSVNALVAADIVVIPFVPEPLPEFTLGDVFKAIHSIRLLRAGQGTLRVRGFIPNRVNRHREALTRTVLNRLPPGIPVLTTIHDSAYVSRAPQSGRTVFQVAPHSLAADEYRRLSQEIASGPF